MRAAVGFRLMAALGLLVGLGGAARAESAAPTLPKLTLHICRMPGLGSQMPAAITIPRGTRFDDKDTALLAQPELAASGPANLSNATPIILTTDAALTLPQNRFCADVAATAAMGTTDQALAAASGRLFAVAGHDNLALLGEIYATFDRGQTDTPASRPNR